MTENAEEKQPNLSTFDEKQPKKQPELNIIENPSK
jgi:hypothetical protein